ncbi:uncharacterized protein LOC120635696 isoform X2 [Pararge aegeria]|uniref:uncharacterized protein LOC120635696 isoform X2 n=1 Tax=Pararge aegeria TaxID=116150 RepID=UPI0019D1D8DE|nr:uncharacterized protein LOC120635696 isoform X2 [Pararge aegeria]
MEEQSKDPLETNSPIEPKEEVIDDIYITDECKDNKDLIVPKEELSEFDTSEDESTSTVLRPIKTETTLSREIVRLQKELKSNKEDTSLMDDAAPVGPIEEVYIKAEPVDEASVPPEPSSLSYGPPLPELCPRAQRGRARQNKSASANNTLSHSAEKRCSSDISQAKLKHNNQSPAHIKTRARERSCVRLSLRPRVV